MPLLPGRGTRFRDPWGNQIEVVQYDEVQFSKAPGVLRGMGLAELGKTPEAVEELREKGLADGERGERRAATRAGAAVDGAPAAGCWAVAAQEELHHEGVRLCGGSVCATARVGWATFQVVHDNRPAGPAGLRGANFQGWSPYAGGA